MSDNDKKINQLNSGYECLFFIKRAYFALLWNVVIQMIIASIRAKLDYSLSRCYGFIKKD
ncbi:MAG: hypothetical protein COW63_00995 [Bacteroidetes bacterium CG18_big_fil_WC_8_21_14_2_50_41_14]|nr:MAG: hypothetical protein COW63_00995 [Bacteroidetes bacterium CG18_big_fil_WC_8_21_14_2_50_41_14]